MIPPLLGSPLVQRVSNSQNLKTHAPTHQKARHMGGPSRIMWSDQRLENWKLLRAFGLPYFLRSTTRLSRVRNPAAFSAGRNVGS